MAIVMHYNLKPLDVMTVVHRFNYETQCISEFNSTVAVIDNLANFVIFGQIFTDHVQKLLFPSFQSKF